MEKGKGLAEGKRRRDVAKPKEERPQVEEKIREEQIVGRTQKKDTIK